jgi:hypothetical protein
MYQKGDVRITTDRVDEMVATFRIAVPISSDNDYGKLVIDYFCGGSHGE